MLISTSPIAAAVERTKCPAACSVAKAQTKEPQHDSARALAALLLSVRGRAAVRRGALLLL